MYIQFGNEKQRLKVEEARLQEIRQEIEAQQLGDSLEESSAKQIANRVKGWFSRLTVEPTLPEGSTAPTPPLRGEHPQAL